MNSNRTNVRYLHSRSGSPFGLARKIFKKGFILVRASAGPRGSIWMFDNQSPHTRGESMSQLLAHCDAPPRTRWFVINTRDLPQAKPVKLGLPMFGSAQADGFRDIAAPDYSFGGWREIGDFDFDATCRGLTEIGSHPPQTSLLGWYGAVWSHPNRSLLLSAAQEHPDRMEIVDVNNFATRAGAEKSTPGMPLSSQVARFRYLIDMEGIGYSGRLKYLLHTRRPVLIQDRPWREWYFPNLVPWVHYVPVRRDLADLVSALNRLDGEPQLSLRIAANALAFATQNLTLAAAAAKWSACISGIDEASPWRVERQASIAKSEATKSRSIRPD